MIKETFKYPKFSEVDFIRLYCAMNFKNGCSPIIKHHELEKKLFGFYLLPEFRDLFQDICPKKDYINPENSYLNLGTALNAAQLFGLLISIQGTGEIRSIISCDEKMAQEIISNTDTEMVNKMTKLFNIMIDLDRGSKERQSSQISDAESTMDNFMKKLDNGDLTYDKEQTIGTKLILNEKFIDEQVKSYDKLLKSPIMQEIQESKPTLVKKGKFTK